MRCVLGGNGQIYLVLGCCTNCVAAFFDSRFKKLAAPSCFRIGLFAESRIAELVYTSSKELCVFLHAKFEKVLGWSYLNISHSLPVRRIPVIL